MVRPFERIVILRCQQAERHAAAGVGGREPDQFFGADRHYGDVLFRRPIVMPQPVQRRHAHDDTRRAVVIAAMRNRIHVRSDHDRRRVPVAAGQGHVLVARIIVRDLEIELAREIGDQPMGNVLASP